MTNHAGPGIDGTLPDNSLPWLCPFTIQTLRQIIILIVGSFILCDLVGKCCFVNLRDFTSRNWIIQNVVCANLPFPDNNDGVGGQLITQLA